MKIFNFKNRNAISTIIGTFFFIVVMVGAFTAFILMMQTNTSFLNTQLDIAQNEVQKIQGQYTIAAAYDSAIGNRLCVSVKNDGSTPLEIADILIVNKTNNAVRQFDIDFKDAFVPVFSTRNILENQPITLTSGSGTGTIYDLKVVSTSGIVQTTELKVFPTSLPDPRFNVTAFAYPINAASGQNVTVGMHVYNSMNTTLINVQPNGDPLVDPPEAVALGFNFVNKGNITRLDPNESTTFLWEPEFVGGVGSKLTFTLRAKALVEGCTTSSYIFNEDSTQVKIVPGVRREILASPETFITFPSPMGRSSGTGVFAIAIQNPTDHPFNIPQISIQLIGPSNPSIISSVTGVKPATGWSTTAGQVIIWNDVDDPIFVEPFGVKEFIVRMSPSNSQEETPVNSIIYNVYSTFGQFGKGPFTSGTTSAASTLVNVFAKSSFGGSTEIFVIPDVPSGSTKRFDFAIANFGGRDVFADSFMLINVPPGLREITSVSETPGTDGLSDDLEVRPFLEFADGSVQIPVRLTTDLAAGTSRTYSFTAVMPSISVPAFYTFTVLANGTTSTNSATKIIGPFSETVLQVCPDDGCP